MPFLFVGKKKKVLPGALTDLSFTSAPLPRGFALARSEAMLARSSVTGRWVSVGPNVPRFDIDPVTLESRGLLVEPGRTQIVYTNRSPQYTLGLATSTLDATEQTPFGLGALKLVPTAVSGIHGFNFFFGSPRASAITDGTTLGIQLTIKPVGAYTRFNIYLLGRDNVYQLVEVSLAGDGAVLSNTAISASIARDTDGYYTVKIVRAFGVGTQTPGIVLSFVDPTGTTRTFVGDGTSHLMIAYLGAEIGSEVTTPMVNTTSGIITRTAETLTSTVTWIGSVQNASFALQYTPIGTIGTAFEVSGAAGNFLAVKNSAAGTAYYVTSEGVSSAIVNGTKPPAGISRTDLITAKSDEFRFCTNGTAQGLDLGGPIPLGLTNIAIGSTLAGEDRLPLVVKRIKHWGQSLDRFAATTFSGNIALEGVPPNLPIISMQSAMTVPPQQNSVTITLAIDNPVIASHVKYRTLDGTAKSGSEFSQTSGELVLLPDEAAVQVTILLGDRPLTEDRTFTFELYDQENLLVENSQCVITLQRVVPQGTPAGSRYDFSAGMPATGWSFTRASTGNYRDSTGLWVSAASGVPRIHHYAPGVVGLLLEPSACEQRLFDSVNPFLPVASNRVLVTLPAGQTTPTGNRLVQWRKDASSAEHKLVGTFPANQCDWPITDATLWFYVRPLGHIHWKLRVKGHDNIWAEARFSFSGDGSVTAVDTAARAYIEQDTWVPEWFRFGLYRSQGATANVTAEFELIAVQADGTPALTGIVTEGFDYCHVQVESSAGMSSPLMVNGASAKTTRAAETLKADPTTSWYKVAPNTSAMKFTRLRDQPTTQRALMFKDVSATSSPDDISIRTQPSSLRAQVKVQGVQLADILSPTQTFPGISQTVLLINDSTKVSLYHKGIKAGEDALTVPTTIPQVLRIAASEPHGTEPMMMLLQTFALWDHAVSDTDALLFSGNLDFVPLPDQPAQKPVVSIPAALSVREGESVPVVITKTGTGACRVSIRTTAQTAVYDTDYVGIVPTVVEFGVNETSKTVTIQTLTDAAGAPAETVNETFLVRMSLVEGDTSCELGNAVATVTILETPRVDISTTATVTEGQKVSVTLTKTRPGECSVTYRTVGVEATTPADYTGVGATVVAFAATEQTKIVQVQTLTDATPDSGETFRIVIENAVNCTLGNASCTVTIVEPGAEPEPEGQIYQTPVVFAHTDSAGNKVDFGIGQVPYYVTRLDDANVQGTLRHALSGSNRLILFEVGGCIRVPYLTGINARVSNVTIAGETAPSPGIIIQDGTLYLSNAKNLCMRHITIERGYDTRQESFVLKNPPDTTLNSNGDAIIVQGGTSVTQNVWIDHCATLWSNDEGIQLWRDGAAAGTSAAVLDRFSITNTIIAEPLYAPEKLPNPATRQNYKGHWERGEPEDEHNYGMMIGNGITRVDIQHSLFSDCYWRNPVIGGGSSLVLANIVSNNCRLGFHHGGDVFAGPTKVTVNGYLKINGKNSFQFGQTSPSVSAVKLHGGQAIGPDNKRVGLDGYDYHKDTRIWAANLYADRGKTTYPMPDTKVWGKGGSTLTSAPATYGAPETSLVLATTAVRPIDIPGAPVQALSQTDLYNRALLNVGPRPKDRDAAGKHKQHHIQRQYDKLRAKDSSWVDHQSQVGGFSAFTETRRSLRDQNAANPGRFANGDIIPAFPADHTNKVAVRAWLRRFLDDVQYD